VKEKVGAAEAIIAFVFVLFALFVAGYVKEASMLLLLLGIVTFLLKGIN